MFEGFVSKQEKLQTNLLDFTVQSHDMQRLRQHVSVGMNLQSGKRNYSTARHQRRPTVCASFRLSTSSPVSFCVSHCHRQQFCLPTDALFLIVMFQQTSPPCPKHLFVDRNSFATKLHRHFFMVLSPLLTSIHRPAGTEVEFQSF